MIIASLSVVPLGASSSVSKYVRAAQTALGTDSNVHVFPNAMATVLQTPDLPTLFAAVERAHQAVVALGAKRVITELKIDDRRDKDATVESKLRSLQ